MKFEEKIKQKYLYSKSFNLFKLLYFYIQKLKGKRRIQKSYSGGAQDLIINYFFRNKKKGVYIDVGCYHPYNGNNTMLLYNRGWSGINIDLDSHTIDFFDYVRKRDENINIAISEQEGEKNLYFFHNRSAINSLSEIRKNNAKEIRKIQTKTLNSVIKNSKFKNEKINLLSIDVEGHEIELFKGFDIRRWRPKLVLLEDHVTTQDKHRFMINNDYQFLLRTGLNTWYVQNANEYSVSLKSEFEFFRKYWLGLFFRKFRIK